MSMVLGRLTRSLVLSVALGYAAVAFGAPAIEEIVVTAEKRESTLLEVPVAVSAYSSEFLAERNIVDLYDLAQHSPSLRFDRSGAGLIGTEIILRGIGSDSDQGIDPTVGLYLDGVYLPRMNALVQSLPDVQVVEVLKGPQGTLFGANTPGGVISVRTKSPTQEFQGKVSATIGEDDRGEMSVFMTGGLTESLAASGALWVRRHDGWMDLMQGGSFNSQDELGGRVKVLWTPRPNVRLQLAADWMENEAQCCAPEWIDISDGTLALQSELAELLGVNRDVNFATRAGEGPLGRGEKIDFLSVQRSDAMDQSVLNKGISLNAQIDMPDGLWGGILDGHSLNVVLSMRDFQQEVDFEASSTGVKFLPQDLSASRESLQAEITWQSPLGQRVEYIAGAFAFQDDGVTSPRTGPALPGCLFNDLTELFVQLGRIPDTLEGRRRCEGLGRSDRWTQEWTSTALFGRVTLNVTERLSISGGARWSRDEKKVDKEVRLFSADSEQVVNEFGFPCEFCTFDGPDDARINEMGLLFGSLPFEDSVDNNEVLWSGTISYRLGEFIPKADDGSNWYFRVAKGYKAPGINARPIRVEEIQRTVERETSINFETGFKTAWFDRRLTANLTLFSNDFEDLQIVSVGVIPGPTGQTGAFIQNAGELRAEGVELEIRAVPTPWLSISSAWTYLNTEFLELDNKPCPTIGEFPLSQRFPSELGICDFEGFAPEKAPDWRSSNTVRLTRPIPRLSVEAFAQGSWNFTGDHFVADDLDTRSFQDAYSIIDLSFGVQALDGRWRATLWANNVTDEEYLVTAGSSNSGIFGATNDSYRGWLGPPRLFGAKFDYNFGR